MLDLPEEAKEKESAKTTVRPIRGMNHDEKRPTSGVGI